MALNEAVYISRADELDYILHCVIDAECCAVVGLSNMGKSVLLRSVRPTALATLGPIRADGYAFIYIDFNLMVEMTEQAFYELILRSTMTKLSELQVSSGLCERLEAAYGKVVDSHNAFLIPLGFNEGIVMLCEELGRQVVFLFDEFDGPFGQIAQRVFLNLRALKDRYALQLCYVVATGQRLTSMRQESEIGEFCELFAHQTLHLGPLNHSDLQHAVMTFMRRENVLLSARDIDFVQVETGGHPGLLEAVCHVLASVDGVGNEDAYGLVRAKLDSDLAVRGECVRLWNGLTEDQHEALIEFVSGEGVDRVRLAPLQRLGILRNDGAPQVFCGLFAGFVRRQRLVKSPYPSGVRVDVDAGEVWVDGRRVATLTDLEYRALLLFYGRMGQLCDKYQIVETVWGEDYIDQVDDARIEKLISRLRKKIEPVPTDPKYLETVRGRGYRMVGA